MPFPGRFDEGGEVRPFGRPAEKFFRFGIISGEIRRLSGPRPLEPDREGFAAKRLHRFDDFEDRMAGSGTQIDLDALVVREEPFKGAHVRVGQILDMDVVAHGAAVAGWEIGPVDDDLFFYPERRLDHGRDQMGFRVVVLSDFSIQVGPGDIEIPEDGRFDAVGRLEIGDHLLDHPFRPAIWVDRS